MTSDHGRYVAPAPRRSVTYSLADLQRLMMKDAGIAPCDVVQVMQDAGGGLTIIVKTEEA